MASAPWVALMAATCGSRFTRQVLSGDRTSALSVGSRRSSCRVHRPLRSFGDGADPVPKTPGNGGQPRGVRGFAKPHSCAVERLGRLIVVQAVAGSSPVAHLQLEGPYSGLSRGHRPMARAPHTRSEGHRKELGPELGPPSRPLARSGSFDSAAGDVPRQLVDPVAILLPALALQQLVVDPQLQDAHNRRGRCGPRSRGRLRTAGAGCDARAR
jgi:hypothetical protein